MENRLNVKDVVLFLFLIVLGVIVVIGIWAGDRQWKETAQVKQELTNVTRDLAAIRRQLSDGVAYAPSSPAGTQPTAGNAGVTQQSRLEAVTRLPGYATGDWLVQATIAPPTKLTPLLDSDLFGSRMRDLMFDSLATRDPDTLDFIPSLATGWTQSADGKTITFKLRRGVTFSDGTPLTADDVVFTFNLVLNPEIEAERERVYLDKIDKVVKLDDDTVQFTFKEFYFQNFLAVASENILSKAFYEPIPHAAFNESVGYVMGTGPYRLADPKAWRYEPGKPFELVRNERHWGVPGPFDRLIYNMQSDPAARLIAFKNGETDRFGATPEQWQTLSTDRQLLAHATPYRFTAPDDGYFYIGWFEVRDGKETPFKDKRVRQAMTLLIDREALLRDVLYGLGSVANGPFDPTGKQADPTIKPMPFDPARAKALLAEAGYVDKDGDGILDKPDGTPFEFRLSYPAASTVLERIALKVKDQMRVAGVRCTPEAIEWSVLQDRMRDKKLDAQISGWGGDVEGDLYQIFHSSQIEGQGDNRVSYANAELDKLIVQARGTVDENERNRLWQRCHAILAEDQPYTFMFRGDNLLFVDKRFENVKTNKMGVNSFREWFVPVAKQKWGK